MSPRTSAFRPRDTLLLLVLALIWGNSFFLIKTAVAVVPPLWIVTSRMVLGALALLVIAAVTRKGLSCSYKPLVMMGLIGVFGCALPWAGQAWAQRYLDSGLMSVLNATTPVATLLLALMFRQERLYANRVAGLTLSVMGTLLVIGFEVHAGRSTLALVAAVLSTFGYALAAVLTHAFASRELPKVWVAATQLVCGALLLGPIAWFNQGPPNLALAPSVLGALGVLGLLGTGLAFLIYFTLLERVGPANTSMVTYLVPVIGLLSGALFRGERFGSNVLLGATAMIVGVWLAQRAPQTAPR